MKITHRIPQREPRSDVVLDERYAAEVERSTRRAERSYAAAVRALVRAELKLARVEQIRDRKAAELASAVVELRRAELEHIEGQMRAVPCSVAHRGTRSYRPVPAERGSLL